jgi:hypothetical protein
VEQNLCKHKHPGAHLIACSEHMVALKSGTFMDSCLMILNHTGDPAKSRSRGWAHENVVTLITPRSMRIEVREETPQIIRRSGSVQALMCRVSQQRYARFVLCNTEPYVVAGIGSTILWRHAVTSSLSMFRR